MSGGERVNARRRAPWTVHARHVLPWLMLGVAAWPTLTWYARRMIEGVGDDRCGLAALGLAVGFASVDSSGGRVAPTRARAAAVAVVGYAILARVAPPLIAALALVVTVVLLARAQRLAVARRPAWLMTCALALPVIASAQFYLGYPLRTCVSAITAQLLNFAGVDVQVEGTALLLRGTRVLVDEPCSGVKTLWTSALFSCALALRLRLEGRAALRFAGWATLCAGCATIARTVVLTLLESGATPVSEVAHVSVGLAVFAGFAFCLLWLARRPLGRFA
jgi:exosortase/archaeosortase family protein